MDQPAVRQCHRSQRSPSYVHATHTIFSDSLPYPTTSLAARTSRLGQRSLRCLEAEVLPAHCLVRYVMRKAGALIVAVIEEVCGLEIQAEDDVRPGVAVAVVDAGVGPGAAPDHEVEYHETSRATSRLSEEHPVGRWLPVDDVS